MTVKCRCFCLVLPSPRPRGSAVPWGGCLSAPRPPPCPHLGPGCPPADAGASRPECPAVQPREHGPCCGTLSSAHWQRLAFIQTRHFHHLKKSPPFTFSSPAGLPESSAIVNTFPTCVPLSPPVTLPPATCLSPDCPQWSLPRHLPSSAASLPEVRSWAARVSAAPNPTPASFAVQPRVAPSAAVRVSPPGLHCWPLPPPSPLPQPRTATAATLSYQSLGGWFALGPERQPAPPGSQAEPPPPPPMGSPSCLPSGSSRAVPAGMSAHGPPPAHRDPSAPPEFSRHRCRVQHPPGHVVTLWQRAPVTLTRAPHGSAPPHLVLSGD